MIAVIVLMVLWITAYVALFVWSLAKKGRLIIGGAALIALSIFPMMFSTWAAASDWHDSPLMALYYLPSILTLIPSLIVLAAGLFVKARRTFLSRGGA